MPKDTFNNLSEEKKKRIFDAAVKEFSTRSFTEASLNQIVKTAEIPWGSFYQYFSDKKDIYLYMMEEIGNERRKLDPDCEKDDPDTGFFETFLKKTREALEFGRVKPEFNRVGMLMEMDNSEFITELRSASVKRYKSKLERDKDLGLIKPDVDTDLVLDLIYTITLEEYFRTGMNEDLYLKRVNNAIKIIREGIAVIKD